LPARDTLMSAVGDVLFRQGGDAFDLLAGIEDDRSEARNTVALCLLRILVQVVEVQAQQAVATGVLAQQIGGRVARAAIGEHVDVDALLDALQDLGGLVGETELAVRGEIGAQRMAARQEADERQDDGDQERQHQGIDAVARRAPHQVSRQRSPRQHDGQRPRGAARRQEQRRQTGLRRPGTPTAERRPGAARCPPRR
jgi:hypothetical protein